MKEPRVVVTEIGIKSAFGEGTDSYWKGLMGGKSAMKKVTVIDPMGLNNDRGAEISDVTSTDEKSRSQAFIESCVKQLKDRGVRKVDAVSLATGIGDLTILNKIVIEYPRDRIITRPTEISSLLKPIISAFDIDGPSMFFTSVCAASNYAIGYGIDLIKQGIAKSVICGGVEEFNISILAGFGSLHALSPDECRPFDKDRKGTMGGEGSALLLLEDLEQAKERGANILCELPGYGLSCEGYHLTTPEPSGRGIAKAIKRAISNSGIKNDDISYVCSHGTGTSSNDGAETNAIKLALANKAYTTPVNSVKSIIGHTGGAASVMEAVACILSIEKNTIPPTLNYLVPDPACDLDYVPNKARPAEVDVVLNNSLAFGGSNSCVVIKRYQND